jgi:formylglycine-generating enzyme required for sulfatase activity
LIAYPAAVVKLRMPGDHSMLRAQSRREAMIRNAPWGLALLLALVSGSAQPATALERKAPQPFVATAAPAPPAASAAQNLKPGSEFKDCDACPPMIVVPAGRFVMGSPDDEPGHVAAEGPRHVVTIVRPFAVGKYEITFDDWEACVAGSPLRSPGRFRFRPGTPAGDQCVV